MRYLTEIWRTLLESFQASMQRPWTNLLLVVVLPICMGMLGSACMTQPRLKIATMQPEDGRTRGWPRLMSDEVEVMLDGNGQVTTLKNNGEFFLVHERDLRGFLKLLPRGEDAMKDR